MNCKRILLFISSLFVFDIVFANEIISVDYYKANKCSKQNTENLMDDEMSVIYIDDCDSVELYSEMQFAYLIESSSADKKRIIRQNDLVYIIFLDKKININNTSLVKTLISKYDDKFYFPGVCVYLNINELFRKKHTFFGGNVISTVFDKNGNSYFMIEEYSKIKFYPCDGELYVRDGASYKFVNNYIDYIDFGTNKLMYYNIEKKESSFVAGLPLFENPKLYYGLKIDLPEDIKDFCLQEIDEYTCVSDDGVVFHVDAKARNPDGTRYFWNTIYLLDFTSDGTRKKGVYKIMGDRFEFYPDL